MSARRLTPGNVRMHGAFEATGPRNGGTAIGVCGRPVSSTRGARSTECREMVRIEFINTRKSVLPTDDRELRSWRARRRGTGPLRCVPLAGRNSSPGIDAARARTTRRQHPDARAPWRSAGRGRYRAADRCSGFDRPAIGRSHGGFRPWRLRSHQSRSSRKASVSYEIASYAACRACFEIDPSARIPEK